VPSGAINSGPAARPPSDEEGNGTPAEPPTLRFAVPNWNPGDTILLRDRTLRVVGVRDDDADQAPVLVVEDMTG
jgi:hypothetical protein